MTREEAGEQIGSDGGRDADTSTELGRAEVGGDHVGEDGGVLEMFVVESTISTEH